MCDQNCKCATKYRAHVRRDDLEPECMHDPMSVGEKPTAIAITGTTTMTITLRLTNLRRVEIVQEFQCIFTNFRKCGEVPPGEG